MPEIEITAMSFGRLALGRLDRRVVMVPAGAPGDLVEVTLTEERKNYALARIERIVRPSAERRLAPCPYLPRCGGCDWQHLSYQAQLRHKAGIIAAELARTAKLDLDPEGLVEAADAEFGYRARLRLKANRDGSLGFREAESSRMVAVERCLAADPGLRMPRRFAREVRCSEIEVVVDEDRQVLVGHLLAKPTQAELRRCQTLLSEDPTLSGIVLRGGGLRCPVGSIQVRLALEAGLALEVDADLFTQVNRAQNLRLVRYVMELSVPESGRRVLDLFCGAGNFTLPVARRGAMVIGADRDAFSVAAGRHNAARLGLSQAQFVCLEAAQAASFVKATGFRPDVIILDPPRQGAGELMPALLSLRPAAIVYVSCNPPTLTRDLQTLLRGGFRIDRARGFDFFPNTHHVEVVARAVLT